MAEFVSTSNPAPTLTHPEKALTAVIRVTASDVRGSKHLLLLRWCEQRKAPGKLHVCVSLWPKCGNRDEILVETSQRITWKESRHIRAVQRERERVRGRRGRGGRPLEWRKVPPASRGAGAPRRCPAPLMVSASNLLVTEEEECGSPSVGSVFHLLFTCCRVMSPRRIRVRLCSDLISLSFGCICSRGSADRVLASCFQPRLQMTAAPPPAAWTWLTAWPIWSSGCRCRRMKSSCWRWPWQMCWKGLTSQRSIRQLLPWQQAGDQQALKVNRYLFAAPHTWCMNNNYIFTLYLRAFSVCIVQNS